MKKKALSIIFVLSFFLILSSPVSAESSSSVRSEIESSGPVKVQIHQEVSENGETKVSTQESQEASESGDMIFGNVERIRTQIQKLTNKLSKENQDQIQNTLQVQSQVQQRVQNALKNIEQRPAYLRFLIGPDYKNVGQVRSEIVRLDAQVRQLTQLRDSLTNQDDINSVQSVIDDLDSQSTQIQNTLQQQTQGFSLFGWLAKLLSNQN
jgi:hypothetical protein